MGNDNCNFTDHQQNKSSKFWIVCRNATDMRGSFRHPACLGDAMAEAARLAGKEGVPFFVLEAIGSFEPARAPVVWNPAQ